MTKALGRLPPLDPETNDLNVVVETPRGSRNKYNYDEETGLFTLGGMLPAGMSFPFDFGFVPSTRGGDGDPLDVLVLMDEPAFCGCLVRCRLIGVIEARQTQDGRTERNDRLIAVASQSRNHQEIRSIDDVSDNLMMEIEHFFVSYNQVKGKQFSVLGRHGPDRAQKLVEAGAKAIRKRKKARRN